MEGFVLTDTQKARLQDLVAVNNFAEAYRLVATWAEGQPGADPRTIVWLRGAAELGSGESVRDGGGNVIDRPTLIQIEQFKTPAGAFWRQLSGACPETSAYVAHQGLNLFVSVGADGAETILDYAYAVSETVEKALSA